MENTHGYIMAIDALHRNRWPVRTPEDRLAGEVIEHIAVALDGMEPPKTDWSWKLNDVEAAYLGRHWVSSATSTIRYARHEEAFNTFVGLHRLAVQSLEKAATIASVRRG